MKNSIPSKAQVRGWKIPTFPTAAGDVVHHDVDSKPVIDTTATTTLRHGYTLDDLNRIARTVVVANAQWWRGAGRHHGLRDSGLTGEAPRFAAYWYEPPAETWEDRALERIALGQILPILDAPLFEAVTALAALGDYAAAADALDLKYPTFTARINRARKAFRQHWYAPETAPATRGTDRRVGSRAAAERTHCSAGHEFTPENTYWRPSSRGPAYPPSRYCRTCEGERRAENKRKARERALQGVAA